MLSCPNNVVKLFFYGRNILTSTLTSIGSIVAVFLKGSIEKTPHYFRTEWPTSVR